MANAGPRYKLMALDPPAWLAQAVEPWRIEAAELWHNGIIRLALRSAKARVPVALDFGRGKLAISILDARIDGQRGASLVRALRARLSARRELRSYAGALASLAARMQEPRASAGDSKGPSSAREAALALFTAWPARERSPNEQVAALPVAALSLTLSPAAEAARILYRFARGEVLEGLGEWQELGALERGPATPFARVHLELVALALVGRRREALELLTWLEGRCEDPEQWLVLARIYAGLDAREAAIAAHEQVLARRDEPWDRLRLARVRGDFAPGEAIPRPAADASESSRSSFVREVVKILDAAGRLDDVLVVLSEQLERLAEPPVDLTLRAATLHLWRGEQAGARARLASLEGRDSSGVAELIEGALELLAGRAEAGLEALERAQARGCTELSLPLWKAEALLALERVDEALACVEAHILSANSLISYLMMLLICARTQAPEELATSAATGTFLDGLVRDVLPSLCAPEALASAHADPRAFAGLVRGLLDQMGGNRSTRPTWCRRDEAGAPHLVPIVLHPTGREAAVTNLVRIRSEAPATVLAGFEPVLAAYPKSPFPCTYRGELLIWLGRYDDALASFVEADTRGRTRWSYVGRAAAYDLLEDAEKSDHWGKLGAEIFGELATATTHVYRGERLRKLGEWERAREDLEIALRAKPKRIGARMNLALVCRATGDEAGWERELAVLERDAPGFLFELGARAGSPIDEALLLACLERMVGNRSSFLHSMVDEHGEFRVVPAPGRWISHVRLCLGLYRDLFARELVPRWLGAPR